MRFIKTILPVSVLLTIVLVCFARTLGSYFLADDFGEIAYVSKIFHGNANLLFSNLTGNYMQIATMNVYRPWLLMSLLFDFALWKTNAFGYYATNVLFMFGDGVMLYAVLRQLTKLWDESRSIITSLLAAALFVSSPLHSEAVSFVVGRVDIICCFYFLASLWCFLKRGLQKGRVLLGFGVLFFWLAILTKEMAISLPVLLTAIAFIFPEVLSGEQGQSVFAGVPNRYTWKTNLEQAVKFSLPLWISTVVYFVIRYCALGTFIGGYSGSVGASQAAHMLEKWQDGDTLVRILYPLNAQVFGATSLWHSILTWLYFVLAALVLSRFLSQSISWRWLFLVGVWLITALLPIYQLWGLGYNLEGARFLFFFTVAMSLLLPFCLFAPDEKENRAWHISESISVAIIALLVIVNVRIASKNNIPWVHAGKETRACLQQAQMLAKRIGEGKHVLLLGLPDERGGAHMILNGTTFNIMMSPPFSATPYADRFITFAPIFFGNSQLLNRQRFKDCLSSHDPDLLGLSIWDGSKLNFRQIALPDPSELENGEIVVKQGEESGTPSIPYAQPYTEGRGFWTIKDDSISIEQSKQGCGILIAPLKLNPFQFDFIQFELAGLSDSDRHCATVFWQNTAGDWVDTGERPLAIASNGSFQNFRLPLSNYWRWFAGGDIAQIRLELPPSARLGLRNLRLVSARQLLPLISVIGIIPNNLGVYNVTQGLTNIIVDARAVSGCANLKLEISKPNYFFENLPDDLSENAVQRCIGQSGNKIKISLANNAFPTAGYYQMRAICLDEKGALVGEKSDPITIYKASGQI